MMRSFTGPWLLAAALALALVGGPQAAGAQSRVLGIDVESSTLDDAQRDALSTAIRAKLEAYPDLDLLAPPERDLTDDMIDLLCLDVDLDCLSKLGAKYEADTVVYAQVDDEDEGYLLTFRVVDVAGPALTRDERSAVATLDGLEPAIAAEIEAAFGPPPAPPAPTPEPPMGDDPAPGTIVIDVNVPNAEIRVDGDYAGTGTATLERPPGAYAVRVFHPGYDEEIFEVEVASGETIERAVTLAAADAGTGKPPDDGADDVVEDDEDGWVVWAVLGAVALGGAVTAIALTTGGEDDGPRAPVVFSIDPNNAWRDSASRGGR